MFSHVKRKFQAPWEEMPVTLGLRPRVTGISSLGAWNFLFTLANILWMTHFIGSLDTYQNFGKSVKSRRLKISSIFPQHLFRNHAKYSSKGHIPFLLYWSFYFLFLIIIWSSLVQQYCNLELFVSQNPLFNSEFSLFFPIWKKILKNFRFSKTVKNVLVECKKIFVHHFFVIF